MIVERIGDLGDYGVELNEDRATEDLEEFRDSERAVAWELGEHRGQWS
jgi:hypothetical protein